MTQESSDSETHLGAMLKTIRMSYTFSPKAGFYNLNNQELPAYGTMYLYRGVTWRLHIK